MKKVWRNIHLYLGIIAGVIFFIECLTGCLLVFEEEITELMYHKRYYVEQESNRLPIDALISDVNTQIEPHETPASLTIFANPRKTIELSLKPVEKRAKAVKEKSKNSDQRKGKAQGDIIYVNPYSGQIVGRVNPKEDTFFKTVLKIHQNLLFDEVGKTILGISTFVVFVILITGIVLWWPKNKKILTSRLKLKMDGSWKRINHDLHVVLGFYCSFFLIIFLVTSLPWSFKWANEALYTLTNSKPLEREAVPLEGTVQGERINWQTVLDIAQENLADAPYWRIAIDTKEEPYQVTTANTKVYHRNGFDQLYINPYDGKIIALKRHDELPGGWQLRRYMKPVHTGSIGGITTKTIAFVVCLVSISFPVTGIILWINRLRKAGKRKKKNKLEVL